MCTSTPAFWKLALVTRIKDLVRDNMASIIEGTVEGAMQVDPSWMTLAAPNDDVPDTNNPLDAILDDMLAKHPVAFLNLQRQLSDKVAADVRGIMDYLQKHVKSSADLHQLFRDSANTLVNTVDTTMPSARPIHQTQPRRDTQVFSLDNLGDDDEEWGDGRGEGASEFSMDAMISRMQPQHSSNVSSRADFIQHLERIPIDRIVDADSDLLRFCNALVPLFFHVDICDRVVAFYWKLVHATDDDIAIQCTMYVDLIATLLALPPSCLFLRKQSVERGAPGTQPRHHHHHPPDDHQRPLLSVSRLVYSFLKLLPNKWIYAPNEVRANAMLATCMFLCHSVDDVAVFSHGGGISSEAPKSSCVLPPSSLLAYLDAPSLWFIVASFQRDPTTIPLAQDTNSFRFPYEASSENMFQSGHSEAQLMHFVTNVIPRQVNTTPPPTTAAIHCRILANITHHWLPRVIRAAMSSPSQGICECVVVLLSEQWCSVDIVKAVAASVSQTPSPLLHVLRIPSFVPAMRAHVIGLPAADRELIVSDLCGTALGLLHFHDLLVPQAPLLDATWASPPPRRSMLRICQLANVPAVAKGWLEHPTRLERWRQAFERIQDHPDGLEAVYGDLAQCPYDLRTEVHDWWHFRRLCATPYAAHAAFPPHKVFGPRRDDVQTYLMSVFCFDLSATTFDGAEAVCDKYMESWFPPCTCHRRPPTHSDYATTNDDGDGVDQSTTGCMLDPPSWMQHSVRQVLAGVGGAHEWKRSCSMDALPSVPGVPCNPDTNPVLQDTTAAAALTALHLSVQQVLERVAASTSSLDFYEHVVDAFWHTLDCLEDIWGVSTSGPTVEMTSWMGDILWAVVCSGTSRSSSRLNETNVRQKQPTADADDGSSVDRALSWANKWMKAYTRRIYHPFSSAEGCSSNSSSSTLLRTLFQAMGPAAADPFVWTCVMMFAARKVDAEVVTFFTTLRNHDDMAAYLWPQLQGHVHLNRPLTRVAAAVELILHADFPHIELALRRLDCPVLSLVLRWQQGCFWNVLNWGDIMGFVTLVCVHGVDSLVYLYVVVLHHIATHQLDAVATGAALLQLQITPRLSWSAYRPLFNRLRKAHYELVAEILTQPIQSDATPQ
ncbi:hypothetical protein DYB34_007064 [Aphanomyces astaci]|uniref:BROMI C-terminal Rab TBC-like domain-containing protein n=1 Tax=Aphanomyces astaci TaxID=112090 RepID=A0A418CE75_APHAT|nr:hypothetical protein DYB34_007064 [Aphanomyces astaci]